MKQAVTTQHLTKPSASCTSIKPAASAPSSNTVTKPVTVAVPAVKFDTKCSVSSDVSTTPFPKELLAKSPVGLYNLGNTCNRFPKLHYITVKGFMNAGIQCLSSTLTLTHYFLEKRYKSEINRNNPLGSYLWPILFTY